MSSTIKRTYPAVGDAPELTVEYAAYWQPLSWGADEVEDVLVRTLGEEVIRPHVPHGTFVIRTSALRWIHVLKCACGEILYDDGEEGNK